MIDVAKVPETMQNMDYYHHVLCSFRKKVNDYVYIAKNDMILFKMLPTSYSQLVVRDAEENEEIIYEIDFLWRVIRICVYFGVILFFVVVSVIVVKYCMQVSKQEKGCA